MTWTFEAIPNPSGELCERVAQLEPTNPFFTSRYSAAMQELGRNPWLLVWRDDGVIVSGCIALMTNGRFQRTLSIPSLPETFASGALYENLLTFCARENATRLRLDTFASVSECVPQLPGELSRRSRREYIVSLHDDTNPRLTSNHKRNVSRARKARITISVTSEPDDSASHVRLMQSSMERRAGRGELVPQKFTARTPATYMRHGCGRLYQAVRGTELLSSVLVLLSERGAYYHSAGTSSQGMSAGASHFLISEIISDLRDQGVTRFSLGGVDGSQPGLERFKAGFGGTPIDLHSAELFVGGPLNRALSILSDGLRQFHRKLARR